MAVLLSPDSSPPVVLRARHLLGRSPGADLRLDDPAVSGEHAVFLWTGEGWELRDLGSRNGTFLHERRLGAGERVRVRAGASLAFGDPGVRWTLRSEAAPSAVAWVDEEVVEGVGRLLALPSEEDPQVVFELDRDGSWHRAEDGEEGPATSGVVQLDGRSWRVELPDDVEPQVAMTTHLIGVSTGDELGLDFALSADEEYLEVIARARGGVHPLPPRAHQHLLLTLARSLLDDLAEGTVPSEAGWVYTSDLRRMLRISANQLYVMSHRCRRELEELGFAESELIEKRTTSRQVRLGIADVSLRRL